jgi:hypothetical protein
MSSSTIAQSVTLFLLAGQCEISGGWLVWQWLREGRAFTWGVLGALVLFLYGVSYLSARPLRPRLCRLWRLFYCLVSVAGLDLRQKCARPLRLDRRCRKPWRCFHHYVLAQIKIVPTRALGHPYPVNRKLPGTFQSNHGIPPAILFLKDMRNSSVIQRHSNLSEVSAFSGTPLRAPLDQLTSPCKGRAHQYGPDVEQSENCNCLI